MPFLSRRQFAGSALAAGLRAADAGNRPNFLVIMADQHNPHVMGHRGDPVVQTPHLDGLARRGVVFESAYCQSPICVPSRMSFMTGAQPSQIGVWTNSDTLASDIPTFAHALAAAGYETSLIGHMHFLGSDQLHGFGKQRVGAIVPMYPHIPYSMPPGMRLGAAGNSHAAIGVVGPGRTPVQAYDADVTRATVDFLKEKAERNGEPWCAVAGFVLPHPPYICPTADWEYYRNRVTLPETPPAYFDNLHPAVKLWRRAREIEGLTPEEIRKARAGYYGLVTHHDRQMGEVFAALERSGLARDTVVIYTSDHGEMAGELGMWWKSSFYESSVGVPLIISCPAKFQPGRRMRSVASLVDIVPTLTAMAGAPNLPDSSGQSLLPLLEGSQVQWKDEAFSEFPSSKGVPPMRMIRSGNWKLVHYEGLRPQLFDLAADPAELRDLGESQTHREVREKLHRRVLEKWSAAAMEAEIARRGKREPLLRRWAEVAKPATPEQWYPPAGSVGVPQN